MSSVDEFQPGVRVVFADDPALPDELCGDWHVGVVVVPTDEELDYARSQYAPGGWTLAGAVLVEWDESTWDRAWHGVGDLRALDVP